MADNDTPLAVRTVRGPYLISEYTDMQETVNANRLDRLQGVFSNGSFFYDDGVDLTWSAEIRIYFHNDASDVIILNTIAASSIACVDYNVFWVRRSQTDLQALTMQVSTITDFERATALGNQSGDVVIIGYTDDTYFHPAHAGLSILTSAEIAELANINSVTISNAQWGIVGGLVAVGSGSIITSAERTALHAIYTITADLAAAQTVAGAWTLNHIISLTLGSHAAKPVIAPGTGAGAEKTATITNDPSGGFGQLSLKDKSDTGNSMLAFMHFQDSADAVYGTLGFNSVSDQHLYLKNARSGISAEIRFGVSAITPMSLSENGAALASGARVSDIDTAMPSSPTDAQLLTSQGIKEYVDGKEAHYYHLSDATDTWDDEDTPGSGDSLTWSSASSSNYLAIFTCDSPGGELWFRSKMLIDLTNYTTIKLFFSWLANSACFQYAGFFVKCFNSSLTSLGYKSWTYMNSGTNSGWSGTNVADQTGEYTNTRSIKSEITAVHATTRYISFGMFATCNDGACGSPQIRQVGLICIV